MNSIADTNSSVHKPSKTPKRETKHRIFVNRSLQLDKIRFYGFDMDYTLAQYKSPQYEQLAFSIIKARLLKAGYPMELANMEYDPSFPLRGLWFDRHYGTLLKMDQFGNILACLRGFKTIQGEELRKMYPNKFVKFDEKRIEIMNTLFSLPETYVLSCIINLLLHDLQYEQLEQGVKKGSVFMSYSSICEDVRAACDWMHQGELKRRTVENIEQYVERDDRVCSLLDKLKQNGAKVFLLTNSDFDYSNSIMSYILEIPKPDGTVRKWTSYFNYIVTDAKKPAFFQEGTILRVVSQQTGKRSIGHHIGPLETGQIYSGGSCEVFSQLIGARGKDVLYVGDHIYGDILKSKKTVGWRTFLIIPELANEIYVWKKETALFDELKQADNELERVYRDLDISSNVRPNVKNLQKQIRSIAQTMEDSYGFLGSMFRNGSRQTFFSYQVLRYADLYSFSCTNLLHYPSCYMFRAPVMLMPHESTVSHEDSPIDSFTDLENGPQGFIRRSRAGSGLLSACEKLHSNNMVAGETENDGDEDELGDFSD